MIAPFTPTEIDEIRATVESVPDAQRFEVTRETLLRLLAPKCIVDISRAPFLKEALEPHITHVNTPEPAKSNYTTPVPSEPEPAPKPPHPNKFVAEFESKHPDWLVREVTMDTLQYTQRVKNYCFKNNIRYSRIQVSPGTVRYYAPDKVSMNELMKVLGHNV